MITNFLWFDNQAEQAVNFYVSIFPNSKITDVSRYQENTPGEAGTVMVVAFELDGQPFLALNGGPNDDFKPPGPVSFMVHCKTQADVDHYWNAFSQGGEPNQCGWIADKYGFMWQIVPDALMDALSDPDREKAAYAMQAMLKMTKIEIAALTP